MFPCRAQPDRSDRAAGPKSARTMHKFTPQALCGVAFVILCLMHAEPSAAPNHPLAGTWELLRAEIAQPDGAVKVDPNYGPRAKGLLIVDCEGRYSLQVFRPDRPKFAAGDKARGTPEEYRAALLGLSTHTGSITVDDAHRKLIFHVDHAAYPNWEHIDQVRAYEFSGDELSYRVPPGPSGTSAISVWRRVAGSIPGARPAKFAMM